MYTLAHVQENQADEIVYYGSERSVVLDNLIPGRTYTYHARATNLVGDGDWSDQYTFLIVDKPSQPLNLRTVHVDKTLVSIAWDQPLRTGGQPITNFNIYRRDCDMPLQSLNLLVSLPASHFSFVDSTIIGGHCYWYFASASNVLGGESE